MVGKGPEKRFGRDAILGRMGFSFDPAVMLGLLTAAALYVRAVRVLRGRAVAVSRWQQAAWYGGLLLMAIALLSPVDGLGEELMSAHMAQHLLIADLAAPLLVTGLRWPVLAFFLPRPAMVSLARRRRLRRFFAPLRRPLVAIAVYLGLLYLWHFAFLFEASVTNDTVHALQHQSFVAGSVLVWWAALEPSRRRMPGELWKIAHILGARFGGMFLGMAFIAMQSPAYDVYNGGYGLTALQDQQLAGALMLSLDFLIVVFVLVFFFFRAASDHDRREAAGESLPQPERGSAPFEGAATLPRS